MQKKTCNNSKKIIQIRIITNKMQLIKNFFLKILNNKNNKIISCQKNNIIKRYYIQMMMIMLKIIKLIFKIMYFFIL